MDVSSLGSELRANFLDFMTYVLPGGIFLVAVIAAVQHLDGANMVAYLTNTLLGPLGNTLGPSVAIALCLAASYSLGMLFQVLDDLLDSLDEAAASSRAWGGLKRRFGREGAVSRRTWDGLKRRFGPEEDGSAQSGAEFAYEKLKTYAQTEWGWKPTPAGGADAALKRSLMTLVDLKASGCAYWTARYAALSNFCDALAWVVLVSSLIPATLGALGPVMEPPGFWLLGAPVVGLIVFLALRWGGRDFERMLWEEVFDTAFHVVFSEESKPAKMAASIVIERPRGGKST